jgi:hypothetical protein
MALYVFLRKDVAHAGILSDAKKRDDFHIPHRFFS